MRELIIFNDDCSCTVDMDDVSDLDGEKVYILPLSERRKGFGEDLDPFVKGIVLATTGDIQGQYVRIGSFSFHNGSKNEYHKVMEVLNESGAAMAKQLVLVLLQTQNGLTNDM